ncbi:MAG: RNA polymerase sigma-70 factor [Verrucomicrobia bacterium]|nr:RNA polymerase sigma-70 factor [Cytophagales bacterium]
MNAVYENPAELLALLKAGDENAFTHIYEQYWEKLYAMAYNRLKSKELTEEIVQDIFTELWLKREVITIQKNIEAYLVASLKYKIFNHIRHLKVKQTHIQHVKNSSDNLEDTTWQQVSFEELYAKMENELNQLPEKCRLVFTLSRHEGYSMKEIAQELDISPKTVEVHIGKALKILRIGLKDYLTLWLLFCSW